MPKQVPKKKAPVRTKVSTKEKTATMVQAELDGIQARLDTKNQNQKNYMGRKKLLEEEKGGSEKF